MHNEILTRKQLEENVIILHKETNKHRLRMTEAVFIHQEQPVINIHIAPELSLPTQRRPDRANPSDNPSNNPVILPSDNPSTQPARD